MRWHDGIAWAGMAAALVPPAAAGELSPPRPVASFLERHCADGWYRFRVTAAGLKLPATGGVWCTVHTGLCVSSAPLLQYITAFEAVETPREIAFECWLPKGHMLEIRPGDVTLKRASFREGQVGAGEGEPQNVPGLAFERIEMERFQAGPGDEALRRLVFGDVPLERDEQDKKGRRLRPRPANPKADAARLVAAFARRAFRRPVPDDVVAGYVKLVHDLLEEKAPFADALRAGYRAILCSARFPISPARGPPTDWGELVQIHDDRDIFQAAPQELPAIDIHSL